jgi:hypothetical protein
MQPHPPHSDALYRVVLGEEARLLRRKQRTVTAHELARMLLDGPDDKVVVWDDCFWREVEKTPVQRIAYPTGRSTPDQYHPDEGFSCVYGPIRPTSVVIVGEKYHP